MLDISDLTAYREAIASKPHVVVHFWASWYEPCQALDAALAQLERECTDLGVVRVEAEVVPDVSEAMEVAAVPLCLLYSQGEKRVGLEGADVAALSAAVLELVQSGAKTNGAEEVTRDAGVDSSTTQRDTLRARLQALVRQAPIMLFMKGSPAEPRCGFSRRVVEALNAAGVKFGHFDILGDDDVRQGLKELSNWPTFPQLYAAGELVGGCDIVLELAASGQLQEELRAAMLAGGDPKQILEARIKALLAQAPVMLFMKGSPEAPRCGFSRKIVDALKSTGIAFSHFDILTDEEVRQGLKEFSNWPTYPQLYVRAQLLGDIDIVQEMQAAGELKATVDDMLAAA